MTKASIRARVLEMRRRLPFEEVCSLSGIIQANFIGSSYYKGARGLALYSSFANEVLTDEIFRMALLDGKRVRYPRIHANGRILDFHEVRSLEELEPGAYDILEPTGQRPGRADSGHLRTDVGLGGVDVVVVPGVAFDHSGARLGLGKGFYDRALSSAGCAKVALAFGFQLLDGSAIPVEEHDVAIDAVVTEKGVFRTRA